MVSNPFDVFDGLVSESILELGRNWTHSFSRGDVGIDFIDSLNFDEGDFAFLRDIGIEGADLLVSLHILDFSFNLVVPALFGSHDLSVEKSRYAREANSALSLSFFVRQVLDAFVDCAWYGRDLPARILARTISEAFDILVIVSLDRDASKEYASSASDPERFYRKYVARGSLPRRRNEIISQLMGADVSQSVEAYLRQEFQSFSQAVHPSYTAGVMLMLSSMPNSDSDPFNFLSGWPCKRAVRFVVYSMSLSLAIIAGNADFATPALKKSASPIWSVVNGAALIGLFSADRSSQDAYSSKSDP